MILGYEILNHTIEEEKKQPPKKARQNRAKQ